MAATSGQGQGDVGQEQGEAGQEMGEVGQEMGAGGGHSVSGGSFSRALGSLSWLKDHPLKKWKCQKKKSHTGSTKRPGHREIKDFFSINFGVPISLWGVTKRQHMAPPPPYWEKTPSGNFSQSELSYYSFGALKWINMALKTPPKQRGTQVKFQK